MVDNLTGLPQLDVAREEQQARYCRSMAFIQNVVSSGGGSFSQSMSGFNSDADLPAMNSAESLDDDSSGGGIERQVLQSNLVLESFGNTRTQRNDNSSRIGKYVNAHFSSSSRLAGASNSTYLLEQVRLVRPAKEGRNYRVFYHFLEGAAQEERRYLQHDLPKIDRPFACLLIVPTLPE